MQIVKGTAERDALRLLRVWTYTYALRGHLEQRNRVFIWHMMRLAVLSAILMGATLRDVHAQRDAVNQCSISRRPRIHSIVSVMIVESLETLFCRNALFEHVNRAYPCVHFCEKLLFLFFIFSPSFFFFKDIAPPQRDLHNCERLFVPVSWPPHTRFGTLGALLWSWFICKWPGTLAHHGAELKTDAYWTARSLSLFLCLCSFISFSSIHIFILLTLALPSLQSVNLILASSFTFSYIFLFPSRLSFFVLSPSIECPSGQSESRVPPRTQRIHAFCGCNFSRNSGDSICTRSHPCSP